MPHSITDAQKEVALELGHERWVGFLQTGSWPGRGLPSEQRHHMGRQHKGRRGGVTTNQVLLRTGGLWEHVSGGEPTHTRHSWDLRNLLNVIQLVSVTERS